MLAAFRVRSFRFQWPADLLTPWAFEIETLILGWYVNISAGCAVGMVVTVIIGIRWRGSMWQRRRTVPTATTSVPQRALDS